MDHHLLEKYFKGNCTALERAEVERWLNLKEELPEVELSEQDQVVQERASYAVQDRISSIQNRKFKRVKYLSAAAVFILISAGTFIFWKNNQARYENTENEIAWHVTDVPFGRKATLKLADGSVIELNGGASLRYPEKFNGLREVQLIKGDAFFNIKKDPDHQFIVHTSAQSAIKVLGTHFNVKNNYYAGRLEITLNRGSIRFERVGAKPQLIRPGEQIYFTEKSNEITPPKRVDTIQTNAWRKNILLFDKTPIQQVFMEVEQFYGVKFIYEKGLDKIYLNAELNNEPLDRVITLIEKSTKLKLSRNGMKIQVKP